MLTETATVVKVEGDKITVSASVKTGCSQCQAATDCGTSAVAKAFTPRQQLLTVSSPLPVKTGDQVMIGIPEQKMLLASLLVYLVPLLAFIGSVMATTLLTQWHELSGFAIGAIVAWVSVKAVSRGVLRRQNIRFEPVIISKITAQPKAV
ncbi:SoxR reducing system RseC family protein [Alteromonas lipolytica]|uniref:Uncharacterized protein n=1 Tax=Alteromonas lipolytica TaxID=1856405 RepID=A0A1E8F9R0_9ALTE|nr:SoxR reducing system RseC family protein [Alteromonas lipolytica]OFI32516.1 hypothetical protein BFC17_04945 [Alteromonas lipolytica]GGF75547.1 sigma E factor positive regulatory protein RseC [Alteromonas lipolytica]